MKRSSRVVIVLVVGLAAALAAPALWWLWRPPVPDTPSAGPSTSLAPPGPPSGVQPAVVRRLAHPIALIGLDGADWQIIDPLIAAGRLPSLARLKSRSVFGHMRSSEPIL